MSDLERDVEVMKSDDGKIFGSIVVSPTVILRLILL